jgi:Transposase DDE domain
MQLTRFLRNEAVKPGEMVRTAGTRTGPRCAGRHVLAIQDTTVIRSRGGGGLYLHAMIAVDAADGAILGAVDGQFLSRSEGKSGTQRTRPIEAKESYRWLEGASRAGQVCARAAKITVIADRESDIYEAFTRRPDNVDVLIRVSKDRVSKDRLSKDCDLGKTSLFSQADALPVAARMELDLPAKPGRKARKAMLVLRFASVELQRPRHGVYTDAPASTRVNLVDVREVDAPEGEPSVHWRLFTTHPVSNPAEASEIAALYRRRWTIEQLFRTMKTQGFDVEGLQIEEETPLRNLAMAIFIAAVVVQQLVHARDGTANEQGVLRPITDALDAHDQPLLEAFNAKLEGKTEKQKNPHPNGSLAYASWVCARLGGWNCYYGKPGPITMLKGWREFQAAKRGVALLTGTIEDV